MRVEFPPEMKRGPRWVCDLYNGLRNFVVATHIADASAVGIDLKTTPTGTLMQGSASAIASGTLIQNGFWLGANGAKVTVHAGNVSPYVGTTLGVSGHIGDTDFTLSGDTTFILRALCDGVSGIVSLAIVTASGTSYVPNNGEKILGTATFTDGAAAITSGASGVGDQNIVCCQGSMGYHT